MEIVEQWKLVMCEETSFSDGYFNSVAEEITAFLRKLFFHQKVIFRREHDYFSRFMIESPMTFLIISKIK